MDRNNQDEILRNYIERVVALQNERHHALQIDDLKGIAREIGMSDDDMLAADRAVETYIERGLRHGVHGRWADAINELSEAVALNPANLRALYGLAVAYKEQWISAANPDDRVQAEELARRCLQLYPDHDPSYQLLNELDIQKGNVIPPRPARSAPPRWLLAVPIVLGILLLAWTFFSSEIMTSDLPPTPTPPVVEPAVAPPELVPVLPEPEQVTGAGSGLGLLGQGIPITWVGKKKEGMGLELREVLNDVGSTRRLQLLIDNTGEIPLTFLEVSVEDFDSYGLSISTTKLTLLSDADSPIAPKTFRIAYLEYPVTGNSASYKLSILNAR